MMLSSLQNALPPCAILLFNFLYLVMVLSHHLNEVYVSAYLFDLLSINNHIIHVGMLVTHYFSLPQMYLKAYWLAEVMAYLGAFPVTLRWSLL